VQELRPGLWTWTAPHPEWTESEGGPDGWERDVRSYAYDAGACLLLFDPMAPPTLLDNLVEAKDVAVLLTCKWHARSADDCVERFGAHVYPGWERPADLPASVEARAAADPEEALFWIAAHGALVAGDVLLGRDHTIRVQPDSWIGEGRTPEGVRAALRPLLDLPVELVLPTHGDPVVEDAHAALRAALDSA